MNNLHYESDYIMRMINLLRLLFEYLLGLTDAQHLRAGDDAIAEALRKLTGLSLDTVDILPPDQLAQMLGDDGESVARKYAVAELLRMRAELHKRLGFTREGEEMDLRAFQMYIRVPALPEELAGGLYPALKTYKQKYFSDLTDAEYVMLCALFEQGGYYADAEDAIRAQPNVALSVAFYNRLLSLPEDKTNRGGLPRHEIFDGLNELTE